MRLLLEALKTAHHLRVTVVEDDAAAEGIRALAVLTFGAILAGTGEVRHAQSLAALTCQQELSLCLSRERLHVRLASLA